VAALRDLETLNPAEMKGLLDVVDGSRAAEAATNGKEPATNGRTKNGEGRTKLRASD
jgi:hypothetical protein